MSNDVTKFIESELEVETYIQNLKYALEHGAEIRFQEDRYVDRNRDIRYINKYTMAKLFPNENPVEVLRRELKSLSAADYIGTVKDKRFPNRADMREFGKVYNKTDHVYIKIRVELLSQIGRHTTFVMSFHFAEQEFDMFPYKK